MLTGTGVVVNNAGIVKKVSFPREILALAAVGSACVFFFFQSCVMVIFMIVLHNAAGLWPTSRCSSLALVAGIVLASALAVLLSSINVYLRDTQHLIEVVLTAWFWACPIVYSFQQNIATEAGAARACTWVYFLNPMTPLVLTFQRCIYAQPTTVRHASTARCRPFHVLPAHGYPLVRRRSTSGSSPSALILFLVALAVFGRLEGNFAEEL